VTPLGFRAGDVVALAREAQNTSPRGPLLVTGVLAERLARELSVGGDPSLVRTDGDPAKASALVRVVAGAATAEDERAMRAATRALVPVVAVQLGDPDVRLPYVLATDVVVCVAGKGFPVGEITRVLAGALGRDGAPLASSLPVLRDAVQERRAEDGALTAGALAMTGGDAPRLPALALAQSRTLSDLAVAGGAAPPDEPRAAAQAVAPALGLAVATGLAARALVRRLPIRNRLLEGAVAAGATYALAMVFRRIPRG
jgi:hypothetical protein